MALVPAANGVESIAALEGIRIVDIGGNRFTIGLNMDFEIDKASPPLVAPWPNGYIGRFFGSQFNLQYSGLYIFSVHIEIPNAAVAGINDHLIVGFRDLTTGLTGGLIPIPIYTQAQSQVVRLCAIADIDNVGHDYRMLVEGFNLSNTLSTPNIVVRASLLPLTCVDNSNPVPPEIGAWEDA